MVKPLNVNFMYEVLKKSFHASKAEKKLLKRGKVRDCLHLVEVLEAFIGEGDGDGKDRVGGVLVEAGFTVSSKQGQSPAPTHRHTQTYKGLSFHVF